MFRALLSRFALAVDSRLAWVTVSVSFGPFGLWALKLQVWLYSLPWWPISWVDGEKVFEDWSA